MNAYVVLKNTKGFETAFEKLISFTFRKDIYQPYTSFGAKILCDFYKLETISEVMFFIDGKLIHHGLADNITVTTSGGSDIISVSSRSFTSMLIQNQMQPGLKTNISINKLMSSFYALPYVTHEDNSETSYIYVKNNSNMWDGIVNLSYKICGTYPYIRETNCVRVTPFENPSEFLYTDSQILSKGVSIAGRKLMSHFHMSNINEEFGEFDLEDSSVIAQNIIRHRFFDLDRQFLYNPQQALEYRSKFASRAKERIFCTYSGYNGEDLSDLATFGYASAERIGAVAITGSSDGIITEISTYRDKFLTQQV
ncbi:MAG: hypothetical protein K2F73_04310 [Ruminococcus sp.]|nr:hypothetical protein [Ruminococcus sp.]MDE6102178.1 hypothetical protein [Ruminococcus sp.]